MISKMLLSMFLSMMLCGASFAANEPTLSQVYEAAQSGRLTDAQRMMDRVLADHPNSAKAHYVQAEIAVKAGQVEKARFELQAAERLDPGLPFAKREAVQELKQRLSSSGATAQSAGRTQVMDTGTSSSLPWALILAIALFVAIVYFIIAMRRRMSSSMVGAGNAPYSGPYSGGAAAAPVPFGASGQGSGIGAGPGIGSGILGGLATGAAVGAGMVAGEALMHRFTDSAHHPDPVLPLPLDSAWDSSSASFTDMGGTDFGVSDTSSWDDSSNLGGDD